MLALCFEDMKEKSESLKRINMETCASREFSLLSFSHCKENEEIDSINFSHFSSELNKFISYLLT